MTIYILEDESIIVKYEHPPYPEIWRKDGSVYLLKESEMDILLSKKYLTEDFLSLYTIRYFISKIDIEWLYREIHQSSSEIKQKLPQWIIEPIILHELKKQ